MNSPPNLIPLANPSLYLDSFPKTPEQLDFGFVIPDWLSRINTVKLFNDFNSNQIYSNHHAKETIFYYSTILTSFHNNTRKLFKLQATANVQIYRPLDIVSDNFYYPILFDCHKLWTDFATEIKRVFFTAIIRNYDYLHEISIGPKSEKGDYILALIKTNENLPLIIYRMKENDGAIIEHIKDAEVITQGL